MEPLPRHGAEAARDALQDLGHDVPVGTGGVCCSAGILPVPLLCPRRACLLRTATPRRF